MHQDLLLYVTKDRHVLVPNKEEGASSSLVVNRVTGDISLEDTHMAIPPIHDQEVTMSICGLLGFIRLLSGDYMIVITERERVGSVCGHEVYHMASFQVLPLGQHPLSGLSETQHDDEQRYIRLLEGHLKMGGFYFSYSYDLTQSLQRQRQLHPCVRALWERADNRFFWNRHASTKLIDAWMACNNEEQKHQYCNYILPVIQGFVAIEHARVNQKPFCFYLITRRDRYHSGTRFFSRGIDRQGHAANFVETEQIVLYQPKGGGGGGDSSSSSSSSSHGGDPDASSTHILSYVQTRGSIPVYWGQIPDLNYTPKLWLAGIKSNIYASRAHFDEQIDIYGSQVLVNLINKRGYELPMAKAYSHVVQRLNDPRLYYIHFDFNQECKNLRWNRIQVLVDQIQEYLVKQGYFYCQVPASAASTDKDNNNNLCSGGVLRKEQTGVVRTNCMDCLDRTNMAQGNFARWILNQQLRQLGILNPGESIEGHTSFMHMYRNVWADNGDAISTAYSGTSALKTDYTRTGRRTAAGIIFDMANSLIRYAKNNFSDGARQDGFDLFLGTYDVPLDLTTNRYKSPFVRTAPLRVRAVPYVLGVGGFMLTLNVLSPSHFGTQSWVTYSLLLSFWASVISTGVRFALRHRDQLIDWPRLVPLPDYESMGGIIEKGEMKPPDYGRPHKHLLHLQDQ